MFSKIWLDNISLPKKRKQFKVMFLTIMQCKVNSNNFNKTCLK